ncbi:hypothetical protein [Streptomyces sp. NBC_01716]|uniref:hypothetical protein n=1 Tax=Streptomyces sp. NBC_01716 TaxID=2975917 RepID=UPI002E31A089|nr:hypothetical protein [Streptomyces sp. NBC_01716]
MRGNGPAPCNTAGPALVRARAFVLTAVPAVRAACLHTDVYGLRAADRAGKAIRLRDDLPGVIRDPRSTVGPGGDTRQGRPNDLGPVRQIFAGPERLARHLAALSESCEYIQYEHDPPPCDAPHRTPRADPRRSAGQDLVAPARARAGIGRGSGR